jgi:hypothetical protein
MNKFVVKHDSWHYRFLKFWDVKWWQLPDDFCSYWRMVMVRGLISFVLVSFVVAIVGGLGYGVYSNPLGVAFGTLLLASVLATSFGVVYAGYGIYKLFKKGKNKLSETVETSDNLFVTKYKSWKDKYCPMVEYE